MKPLAGQVALITGAARGIGQAIAQRLAEDGALVIVSDRDASAARDTASRLQALSLATSLHLDVTDHAAAQAAVDSLYNEHGRIDVLVSNAGAGKSKPFLEMSEDELQAQMTLNFGAVYVLAQACARKCEPRAMVVSSSCLPLQAWPARLGCRPTVHSRQVSWG